MPAPVGLEVVTLNARRRSARGLVARNDRAPMCGTLAKALCRTRTDDPFLTMEVLYQLS
jgi:hypothetical protein